MNSITGRNYEKKDIKISRELFSFTGKVDITFPGEVTEIMVSVGNGYRGSSLNLSGVFASIDENNKKLVIKDYSPDSIDSSGESNSEEIAETIKEIIDFQISLNRDTDWDVIRAVEEGIRKSRSKINALFSFNIKSREATLSIKAYEDYLISPEVSGFSSERTEIRFNMKKKTMEFPGMTKSVKITKDSLSRLTEVVANISID